MSVVRSSIPDTFRFGRSLSVLLLVLCLTRASSSAQKRSLPVELSQWGDLTSRRNHLSKSSETFEDLKSDYPLSARPLHLPTLVRDFNESQLSGRYAYNLLGLDTTFPGTFNDSGFCPGVLEFRNVNIRRPGAGGAVGFFSRTSLFADGARCEGGGDFSLEDSEPDPTSDRFIDQIGRETTFLRIRTVENLDNFCGNLNFLPTYSLRAVFSEEPISLRSDGRSLELPIGEKMLFFFIFFGTNDTRFDCIYLEDDNTESRTDATSSGGLSTGAIVGIVIGSLVGVSAVVVAIFVGVRISCTGSDANQHDLDPCNVDDLRSPPNEPGDD